MPRQSNSDHIEEAGLAFNRGNKLADELNVAVATSQPEPWLEDYNPRPFKAVIPNEFVWASTRDRIAPLVNGKIPDPSVPTTNDGALHWVKKLFKAVLNMKNIIDKPVKGGKICQAGERLMSDLYPDFVIERLCWDLYDKSRTASMGIPLVEAHHGMKFETEHATFADRMNKIIKKLTESKAACKQLLDPAYIDRVVDAPVHELKAKTMNIAINSKRDKEKSEGRRILAERAQTEVNDDRQTVNETPGPLSGNKSTSQSGPHRTPPSKFEEPTTILTKKRKRFESIAIGEDDDTPIKNMRSRSNKEKVVHESDESDAASSSVRKYKHKKSSHNKFSHKKSGHKKSGHKKSGHKKSGHKKSGHKKSSRRTLESPETPSKPASYHAGLGPEQEVTLAERNQLSNPTRNNPGMPYQTSNNFHPDFMPSDMNNSHSSNLIHTQQYNSVNHTGLDPFSNGDISYDSMNQDYRDHHTSQPVSEYPPLVGFQHQRGDFVGGINGDGMLGGGVNQGIYLDHVQQTPRHNNGYQSIVGPNFYTSNTTGHQHRLLFPEGHGYEYGVRPTMPTGLSPPSGAFESQQPRMGVGSQINMLPFFPMPNTQQRVLTTSPETPDHQQTLKDQSPQNLANTEDDNDEDLDQQSLTHDSDQDDWSDDSDPEVEWRQLH